MSILKDLQLIFVPFIRGPWPPWEEVFQESLKLTASIYQENKNQKMELLYAEEN